MTPPIGGEEITKYTVASFLEKGKLSDLSEIKSGELKIILEEVEKREAQQQEGETESIDPKLQARIDQANKRRDEEIKAAMEVNYDEVELQGIKTFYAPAPSKDGSRLVRNTTEENKETFSVYELKTTNVEGTRAVFKIIPSEEVAKRTQSLPDSYIDPACHYKLNWKTPITTKHTTYQAGEARLEGDRRVVFKKAEIYINGISPKEKEIKRINDEYDSAISCAKTGIRGVGGIII